MLWDGAVPAWSLPLAGHRPEERSSSRRASDRPADLDEGYGFLTDNQKTAGVVTACADLR